VKLKKDSPEADQENFHRRERGGRGENQKPNFYILLFKYCNNLAV